MTTLPAVTPVSGAVFELLDSIPHLNVYSAEVVPKDPPLDDDGSVHPYAVYFPGGGSAFSDRLNDIPTDLDWSCRILMVGGDVTRALWVLDRVRAKLTGARPIEGGARLKETKREVIFRTDSNVTPSRTSGLIIYRLHI